MSIPPRSAAAAPSTAVSPSPPTVPSRGTGNVAYDKVVSKLEPGGVGYLYWSAERVFGELSRKFGPVPDVALSDPDLTPGEKEQIRKCFELASRCTAASGIQNLKAFGFSSREAEPGIFLNKSFLYAPDRSGFLWDTFAKRPHDFPELEMVPAKAQGFFGEIKLPFFSDYIDVALTAAKKGVSYAQTPIRRYADTPIRRYADTSIRRYADLRGNGFGFSFRSSHGQT